MCFLLLIFESRLRCCLDLERLLLLLFALLSCFKEKYLVYCAQQLDEVDLENFCQLLIKISLSEVEAVNDKKKFFLVVKNTLNSNVTWCYCLIITVYGQNILC